MNETSNGSAFNGDAKGLTTDLKTILDGKLKISNRTEDFRKFRPLVKELCDLATSIAHHRDVEITNLRARLKNVQAKVAELEHLKVEDDNISQGLQETIVEREETIKKLKAEIKKSKPKKKAKKASKK